MGYPPYNEMYNQQPTQQNNPFATINLQSFNTNITQGRFFVIKSYSEDDIHKSIKYNVWSSTKEGNTKLDNAFKESAGQFPIYLFFSVNASGQFVGVAEMKSGVDYNKSFGDWAQQGKWTGQFDVQWIFVKDIPNKEFRSIILENNEGKPVTNSRDTQEVFLNQACQMLQIFKLYRNRTSILDDFEFYDKRQVEMDINKQAPSQGENPNDLLTNQIKTMQLNPKSIEFQFKGTLQQSQKKPESKNEQQNEVNETSQENSNENKQEASHREEKAQIGPQSHQKYKPSNYNNKNWKKN